MGQRFNKSAAGMWAKIIGTLVLTALIWEIKPVFYGLWRPLQVREKSWQRE